MRDFLIALLECSVSMSVLAVVLMALTPLLSKRYAAKWLYYTWLIIVVGLIIPFRFHFTIPIFRMVAVPSTIQQIIPVAGDTVHATNQINTVNQGNGVMPWIQIIAALWLSGAAAFLIYHGLRHTRFLRMVRRWGEQAENPQIIGMLESIKKDIGIVKPVKLLICSCISRPTVFKWLWVRNLFNPKYKKVNT